MTTANPRVFRSPHPPHTVGIDAVPITDVAGSMARFGDRYLDRVFTPAEIRYCADAPSAAIQAERFAVRFAAKEATFKALAWGDRATDWRAVEVQRAPDGTCEIALRGAARQLAEDTGIRGFAVSLSHEGDYATAVVMAWRG
jgi:holo-[acyl-carrier protein] synthase